MKTNIKYIEFRLPCTQEFILLGCKGNSRKLAGLEGDLRAPWDAAGKTPINVINGEDHKGELVWQSVTAPGTTEHYTVAVPCEGLEWDGECELEDPYPDIDDCLFVMFCSEDGDNG